MFKRRNTLDSPRPSFSSQVERTPPPVLPPLPSDDFTRNVLQRIPTIPRVKVPSSTSSNSGNNNIPNSNSANFSRPSSDSNRNGNYSINNSNSNNYSMQFNGGGGGGIPRSSSTATMSNPPPLPSHAINQYKNNRSSTYSTHSIASLYPSNSYSNLIPPMPNNVSFNNNNNNSNNNYASSAASMTKSTSLPNIRRLHKQSPSYNILVAGAKNSGKTQYIKTLINNLTLVKNSGEKDALSRIDSFGNTDSNGSSSTTNKKVTKTITLEIVTESKEKLNLTLVDTVGLDVLTGNSVGSVGHEMELERQMDGVMRIIEDRFEETFQAENETFRAASTKVQDSFLHLCLYFLHPQSCPLSASTSTSTSTSTPIFLNPLDLRALKRLSRSVNVLPVLSRSDELTISQLNEWKEGIKKELNEVGLELNPFILGRGMGLLDEMIAGKINSSDSSKKGKTQSIKRGRRSSVKVVEGSNGDGINNSAIVDSGSEEEGEEGEEGEEEEDVPVKVIKIKRSTSRVFIKPRGLKSIDHENSNGKEEEVFNWDELLPFAVVAPDTFIVGEKKFIRIFKYGTLDVLNPMHSDFVPLKKALFSSNSMKYLKESTRQEKYEPFRTSKLLARRGTRGGAEEEAILRDLSRI